jgi:hypothetical protein
MLWGQGPTKHDTRAAVLKVVGTAPLGAVRGTLWAVTWRCKALIN